MCVWRGRRQHYVPTAAVCEHLQHGLRYCYPQHEIEAPAPPLPPARPPYRPLLPCPPPARLPSLGQRAACVRARVVRACVRARFVRACVRKGVHVRACLQVIVVCGSDDVGRLRAAGRWGGPVVAVGRAAPHDVEHADAVSGRCAPRPTALRVPRLRALVRAVDAGCNARAVRCVSARACLCSTYLDTI